MHLDAIQGKFRVKRKDYGIGFEDSGSESDEEAGKIRRKGKKRRVQNDNIAALGTSPAHYLAISNYLTNLHSAKRGHPGIREGVHCSARGG